MPTYVYEVIRKDGKPGKTFEVMQPLTDPPLTRDPKTGKPVRRIIAAPHTPKFRYDRTVKHFEKEDRKREEMKQRAVQKKS